jgi:uncharacterized protein YoaH (UPF0181 family)
MPMDFWAAAMPSGSAVQQVTYAILRKKQGKYQNLLNICHI